MSDGQLQELEAQVKRLQKAVLVITDTLLTIERNTRQPHHKALTEGDVWRHWLQPGDLGPNAVWDEEGL